MKIQTELQRLTGTHKHKRNSRYLYDAYYLIISDNGDVALDMGKSSTGPSLGTYFDYRLAYVNLEKSSFYVLCANYPQDIDHVSYGITLNSTYITLSKAWGSIDNGLFAANYS